MKRALARVLAIGGATTTLFVGLVGFAHTDAGRLLLGAVTRLSQGGCPFGYDKPMTPAQRERASLVFAATHRGEQRAASRPALGFVLDHTTRSEVVRRMAQHGVVCTAGKGLSDLTCNGVPTSALLGASANASAPARNLWLTFGTKQQLLSIISVARDAQPEALSTAFVATRSALDRDAGAVTQTHGNADPRALSVGDLHQASAEFRFTDYYALARLTNLGKIYLLTEEYRALPN